MKPNYNHTYILMVFILNEMSPCNYFYILPFTLAMCLSQPCAPYLIEISYKIIDKVFKKYATDITTKCVFR